MDSPTWKAHRSVAHVIVGASLFVRMVQKGGFWEMSTSIKVSFKGLDRGMLATKSIESLFLGLAGPLRPLSSKTCRYVKVPALFATTPARPSVSMNFPNRARQGQPVPSSPQWPQLHWCDGHIDQGSTPQMHPVADITDLSADDASSPTRETSMLLCMPKNSTNVARTGIGLEMRRCNACAGRSLQTSCRQPMKNVRGLRTGYPQIVGDKFRMG